MRVFLLVIFFCSILKNSIQGPTEKQLLNDLLETYNTLERPVSKEGDALLVKFGITLMQIFDLDEKNQLLITTIWLRFEWNDFNLRWNTSHYGNISNLRIPPSRIWKPDVLLFNSADESFDRTFQTNVVVLNDGNCSYIPPGIFRSTCKIDITWFPFDEQMCELKFGSWTYDGSYLDLQLYDTEGDISSFIQNGEWALKGVPGSRKVTTYDCCPDFYPEISFTVHIQRRTLYYYFNLIGPCVLISSLSLVAFTLPPGSGEKLSLGVTILLSLTLFLDMVAQSMPTTSEAVPLLGTYFNCILFMVASSVVSTIVILTYHHRTPETHEMFDWFKLVFLQVLPWLLRMTRPGTKFSCSNILHHGVNNGKDYSQSNSTNSNLLTFNKEKVNDGSLQCQKWNCKLFEIRKEITKITKKLRENEEAEEIVSDWVFAAMVMDRICLIVFTAFTIIASLVVISSAPTVWVA